MTNMTQVHQALADASRAHILDVLRATTVPLSAAQIADAVELHVSTVRTHLRVLAEANLVESATMPAEGPGRPKLAFSATPAATNHVDGGYRLLAEILVSQLADPDSTPLESGQRWGAHLIGPRRPGTRTSDAEAIREVVRMMDRLGFAPSVDDDTIQLRRCPFADLARQHEDVICRTHLGIVRGALTELGTTVTAEDLRPFVQPALCTVQLSAR